MFKPTALLLSLGAAATFSTMAAAPALAQTPAAQPAAHPASCPAVLKHTFNRLQDEAPQDLCQYAGKVVLVVNTASYCGFTKQYEGLEKLYAKYAPRGLVVLGFPSNDFKQEDADAKKIAAYKKIAEAVNDGLPFYIYGATEEFVATAKNVNTA